MIAQPLGDPYPTHSIQVGQHGVNPETEVYRIYSQPTRVWIGCFVDCIAKDQSSLMDTIEDEIPASSSSVLDASFPATSSSYGQTM